MHDEAGFLSAIRQTPADDTARLVFADWLDEQDDPLCKPKAEFIRLERQVIGPRDGQANRFRNVWQLRQLAAHLDPAWLVVVSRPALHGCQRPLPPDCPNRWDRLAPTDEAKIRRCETCRRSVHYCDTLDEARNHSTNGTLFALTLADSQDLWLLRPPQPPPPRFIAPPRGTRPLPFLPPPPPAEWVPESAAPPTPRSNRKKRRKKGRGRNRNIQREPWEDAE